MVFVKFTICLKIDVVKSAKQALRAKRKTILNSTIYSISDSEVGDLPNKRIVKIKEQRKMEKREKNETKG